MSHPTASRRRLPVAALSIAFAALLGAAPAGAQAWKAEWDKVVAAAKKEGVVSIAASRNPVTRRAVEALWPKAYPGIKLKATVAGGGWPVRAKGERDAGKYLYDVYLSSASPSIYKYATELLDPLQNSLILPDVADAKTWGGWENAFADKQNNRLLAFATFTGTIWYNASVVPPAKADALGFKILLDPAYKGKIGWWDPRSGSGAGTTYAHLIYRIHGWDTLKKIIDDQKSVFFANPQAASQAFVRNKIVFSVGSNLNNRLARYRKAGVKFDIRPLGRSPKVAHNAYGGTVIGAMKNPPNPNAAKLFINWFLTKEVQTFVLKRLRHNARRVDIPVITKDWIAAIPGAKYDELQNERHVAERRMVAKRIRELRP